MFKPVGYGLIHKIHEMTSRWLEWINDFQPNLEMAIYNSGILKRELKEIPSSSTHKSTALNEGG